jgi:hypothetical protein
MAAEWTDVDALASHVEARSFMDVLRVAHKLKGAAQMLGWVGIRVSRSTRALEAASKRVGTMPDGGGEVEGAEVAARALLFVTTVRDLVGATMHGEGLQS